MTDIFKVRTTRTKIIHLRNDYKDLTKRIEAGLEAHFAASADKSETSTLTPLATQDEERAPGASPSDMPFARVNTVSDRSPAKRAGMQAGDLIVTFGDADWLNHDGLSKVAQIVARNEGVSQPSPLSGARD